MKKIIAIEKCKTSIKRGKRSKKCTYHSPTGRPIKMRQITKKQFERIKLRPITQKQLKRMFRSFTQL